ncbi:phage tail assembly chaperone [Celerinatantimonas sp. YJH-8]|uniref:phage tail assembly chaperone n=1 Tax=Celerinatantimonas sp. YJH-8 TaxID=3228714 RepID=UPI0038C4B916
MKYFRDENNKLYGFDDDVHQDYIDSCATKWKVSLASISEDTYKLALAPTAAQKRATESATLRSQRDELVERVSREINRLEDKSEDASAWRTYREALRNVPEQTGFPFDVTWPQQPAEFTGK